MRNWKPIFIEHSRIPIWLSVIAPIHIEAITLGCVVIARGKMNERIRNHETIHFQQYIDLLFVGFWLVYLWDWMIGLFLHKKGDIAYYSIRAEQEAYTNDANQKYLSTRKRWVWLWRYSRKSPYRVSSKKDMNPY